MGPSDGEKRVSQYQSTASWPGRKPIGEFGLARRQQSEQCTRLSEKLADACTLEKKVEAIRRMSHSGLVSETDVAGLGVEALRKVLNRLLAVESSIRGVPVADLDLTLREYDPDAGIDARVLWPAIDRPDILYPGENVLQYKTGNVGRLQIAAEFGKSGVHACLKKGGHYHLLISQDYNAAKLTVLQNHMAGLCRSKKIPKSRCHILVATHIARWICRHPAVVTMRELGKGLPGFSTVENWSRHPSLRNPWKPDSQRVDIQSRVGNLLEEVNLQDPVIRLEGPAGVGKTRLALECIHSAQMANRTIYARNSDDPNVLQLLSAIQSDPRSYGIVVVDECDRDRHNILRSYAELSEGRLRLLCVGPGDSLYQSPAEFSNVFVVSPMSDSDLRVVLTAEVTNAPAEITEVAVRLAGGYAKLAFFVATAIMRDSTATSNEIRGSWDIRGFLKRFLSNETTAALGALSLFERLGWEGELRSEARAVAEYLGIGFADFQRGVKTLRDQGVVLARGRYLYVTPELLAIESAASLWDTRGTDLAGIIDRLPDIRPRRELLKRLAAMGRHPEVRRVVELLLGDDGLFNSLEDLDEAFRSEAFRILASALPEAASRVLTCLIEPGSREELLGFKIGRRNLISAIGTLLRWPSTSLQAARSLRALALAENEGMRNNATGIFLEYFQIHLSGSPVSFLERIPLVDELIAAEDEPSRMLAASAMSSSLSSHEFRFGGNVDELSKRPYPPEWRPVTLGDLWDAREAALLRLERIAAGRDRAALEARKAQIACVFTLMRDGMFSAVVAILKSAKPETDEDRRAVVDASLRLERDCGEHLSAEQKEQLENVRLEIFDDTYLGKLKRWVGRRLHADYTGDVNAALQKWEAMAFALAEEAVVRGISEEELAWLTSTEAENVWPLGLRLGELDVTSKFFDRIVMASSEDINTVALAAYLAGRQKAEGDVIREQLIDRLAADHPMMAFGCTWRSNATERGFRRIVSLVSSGRVRPESIGFLVYGAWTTALPAEQVGELIRLLSSGDKSAAIEPSLTMLHELLERRPDATDTVEPLAWEVLESTPPDASVMSEWRWGHLAPAFARRNPQRMIRLLISQYSSDATYTRFTNERHQAFQIATIAAPKESWTMVSQALLQLGPVSSYNLRSALRGWYGDLIPVEDLVSWAKAHEPEGPNIAADIIGPSSEQLSPRARALVIAFPDNDAIFARLWGKVVTGFFAGPLSARSERDLAIVKRWEQDPDPAIRSQVKKYIKAMERTLRAQKLWEEEGSL